MDTLIGKTISNFRVEELIAQGGAGAVYKARDMTINRLVAVKRILPQYVKDKEFIRRFEAEAQTIAKLEGRQGDRLSSGKHCEVQPIY